MQNCICVFCNEKGHLARFLRGTGTFFLSVYWKEFSCKVVVEILRLSQILPSVDELLSKCYGDSTANMKLIIIFWACLNLDYFVFVSWWFIWCISNAWCKVSAQEWNVTSRSGAWLGQQGERCGLKNTIWGSKQHYSVAPTRSQDIFSISVLPCSTSFCVWRMLAWMLWGLLSRSCNICCTVFSL